MRFFRAPSQKKFFHALIVVREEESKNDACENCSTLLKPIEYLQRKMGTKSLNQILEKKH